MSPCPSFRSPSPSRRRVLAAGGHLRAPAARLLQHEGGGRARGPGRAREPPARRAARPAHQAHGPGHDQDDLTVMGRKEGRRRLGMLEYGGGFRSFTQGYLSYDIY